MATDLISRNEAAQLLGISYTQAIRWEKEKRIIPAKREGRKTLYRREDILHFDRGSATPGKKKEENFDISPPKKGSPPKLQRYSTYSGEVAASLFHAFDEGKCMADMVIEKQIHPDVVFSVHQVWTEMRNYVVITHKALKQITELGLDGTYPVTSEDELLSNLREVRIASDPCARCKGRSGKGRLVCGACVEELKGK